LIECRRVDSTESFAAQFLAETAEIAAALPAERIDRMADGLARVRERGGRLFILGIGGGAGHASHAVNDFRKLCHIECYAPTDNVSELTARTNDEGFETTFTAWLRTSRLAADDALLVFSVGGGSLVPPISVNLARAVQMAREIGADVFGIVGRSEGTTAALATECIVVPAPAERLTPHVEAFQAVVWHLLVSHPSLAAQTGKWESAAALENRG
jgi:D-sedoheptulose 7-phosphate isomerase